MEPEGLKVISHIHRPLGAEPLMDGLKQSNVLNMMIRNINTCLYLEMSEELMIKRK